MRTPTIQLLPKLAGELAKQATNSTGKATASSVATSTDNNTPTAELPANAQPPSRPGSGTGAGMRKMFTMVDDKSKLPKGAVRLGFHGTNKSSIDRVIKHAGDMSQSGNISGEGLGPGLYGSTSDKVAAFYANREIDVHLKSANIDDKTPHIISIHMLPSEHEIKRVVPSDTKIKDVQAVVNAEPAPHHVVLEKSSGDHEFLITPKALADPQVQYFGVTETETKELLDSMAPTRGPFSRREK